VAGVVDGDAAIGEDTIDVETEELDAFNRHGESVPAEGRGTPGFRRDQVAPTSRSIPRPR
jgi:hypothetical protein